MPTDTRGAPKVIPAPIGIIGIVGSPRKNGNGATLLQELFRCLDRGCRTETVFLAEQDIRPCDGCHRCERTGSCGIDDDMAALSDKLMSARAIVVATPSCMGSVTSRVQMLMERTWPLRKGQLAGRLGTYIVTGRRQIGVAVSALEEYFTRLGLIKVPGVMGFGFEAGEIMADREAVSRTRELAAALCRCLHPPGGESKDDR